MKRWYGSIKMNAEDVLRNVTHHLRIDGKSLMNLALGLIVFSQFCLLTYSISLNVDSWPIINASDSDGANAIRVSERSFWLKDNGFTPYGNLYFNLAHTIALVNPFSAGQGFKRILLENDRGHHFALMLVSLCSLYGIAYLVSSVIANSTACRLLSVFVLMSVFIMNKYWTTWLFRAHPDMLFSFFVALALFLTIRYLAVKLDVYFNLSAIVWGLALATKLTALTFLPMLFFVFTPPLNKTTISKSYRYYLTILISYLVIGFPQNLKFPGHFRFLRHQSDQSLPPTVASMTETLTVLINQSAYLLGAILVLYVIFHYTDEDKKAETVDFSAMIRAGGLALFPLLAILAQRILSLHEHYVLPIAGCLLVLAAYSARNVTQYLPVSFLSTAYRRVIILLLAVVSVVFFRWTPNAVATVLTSQTQGRSEAQAFVLELARYQKEGVKVLADPYVPWDENFGNVQEAWYRTMSDIRPGNADILAFNRNYYGRYLEDPPSMYVQTASNWRDVRKFYELFAKREQAIDPYHNTWIKVHSSPHGWEIWKLQK
jgi:hypothetical protein